MFPPAGSRIQFFSTTWCYARDEDISGVINGYEFRHGEVRIADLLAAAVSRCVFPNLTAFGYIRVAAFIHGEVIRCAILTVPYLRYGESAPLWKT